MTSYGFMKGESKELPHVVHEDEHIGGVVYGQIGSGNSAMLVATDKRVIFLDKRPLFMTTDELTYDVVSGVKSASAGLFNSLTLHTRINDYILRFVNAKCAHNFVKYIEHKRLEIETDGPTTQATLQPTFQNVTNDGALTFLKEHDLAVLSSVDRSGNVQGAVVYYLIDQNDFIYILTKSGTGKSRNIFAHHQVALTVHEAGTLQTVQVQGIATIEADQAIKDRVVSQIVKPRPYRGENLLPPVTKLHKGSFMVIKIHPTFMGFHDYAKE